MLLEIMKRCFSKHFSYKERKQFNPSELYEAFPRLIQYTGYNRNGLAIQTCLTYKSNPIPYL